MDKPREFWIFRDNKGINDVVLFDKPYGSHSSSYVHVIEKSAYDRAKEISRNLEHSVARLEKEVELLKKFSIHEAELNTKLIREMKDIKKLEKQNEILRGAIDNIMNMAEREKTGITRRDVLGAYKKAYGQLKALSDAEGEE